MGWVQFIVSVTRLIFSIWAPRREGRLAHAKTVMNSLLLSKPQEMKKDLESFCPLGECSRKKG